MKKMVVINNKISKIYYNSYKLKLHNVEKGEKNWWYSLMPTYKKISHFEFLQKDINDYIR